VLIGTTRERLNQKRQQNMIAMRNRPFQLRIGDTAENKGIERYQTLDENV